MNTALEILLLAALPVILLVYLIVRARQYLPNPALEALATDAPKTEKLSSSFVKQLERQHMHAFKLVIISGVTALAILVVSFILLLIDTNRWPYAIVQLASGLGDAAVCRYFYRVWARLTQVLSEK